MKTIKILKKIHLDDYASIKSPYTEVFGLIKDVPEKFYKECLPFRGHTGICITITTTQRTSSSQ